MRAVGQVDLGECQEILEQADYGSKAGREEAFTDASKCAARATCAAYTAGATETAREAGFDVCGTIAGEIATAVIDAWNGIFGNKDEWEEWFGNEAIHDYWYGQRERVNLLVFGVASPMGGGEAAERSMQGAYMEAIARIVALHDRLFPSAAGDWGPSNPRSYDPVANLPAIRQLRGAGLWLERIATLDLGEPYHFPGFPMVAAYDSLFDRLKNDPATPMECRGSGDQKVCSKWFVAADRAFAFVVGQVSQWVASLSRAEDVVVGNLVTFAATLAAQAASANAEHRLATAALVKLERGYALSADEIAAVEALAPDAAARIRGVEASRRTARLGNLALLGAGALGLGFVLWRGR